jgi:hypothetical protein
MSCEWKLVLAYCQDGICVSLRNDLTPRARSHISERSPALSSVLVCLCVLIEPHDVCPCAVLLVFNFTRLATPSHLSLSSPPIDRSIVPFPSPLLASPRRCAPTPGSQRQADRSTLAGRLYKCAPPRYLSGQTPCMSPRQPSPYSDPRVSFGTVTVYSIVAKPPSYALLSYLSLGPPALFCSFSFYPSDRTSTFHC